MDGPLVVLFKQQRAGQSGNRGFVRKDADDIGAALDLAIETFERISIGYAGAGFRRARLRAARSLRATGTGELGARKVGRPLSLDEL